ncbi:unnamed protein product, partial [Protopolystoma xenopodis]
IKSSPSFITPSSAVVIKQEGVREEPGSGRRSRSETNADAESELGASHYCVERTRAGVNLVYLSSNPSEALVPGTLAKRQAVRIRRRVCSCSASGFSALMKLPCKG